MGTNNKNGGDTDLPFDKSTAEHIVKLFTRAGAKIGAVLVVVSSTIYGIITAVPAKSLEVSVTPEILEVLVNQQSLLERLAKNQETANEIQRTILNVSRDTNENLERAMKRQVTKDQYEELKSQIERKLKNK